MALRNAAGIQAVAAELLKVSRSTVCKFIQKHPELQAVINDINDEVCDLAVGKLLQAIREGDFNAIKYYLENKGQAHGYGLRKTAFGDGEGNVHVPGTLVAPRRAVDIDEWQRLHAPPATAH